MSYLLNPIGEGYPVFSSIYVQLYLLNPNIGEGLPVSGRVRTTVRGYAWLYSLPRGQSQGEGGHVSGFFYLRVIRKWP